MVGFYPRAIGGRMDLEVFLDGRDAADKAGTLWAQDFAVLGDPVFSEVIQPPDAGRPEPGRRVQGRKKVYQEQIPFDLLRVPFSVGNGQFVMNDAVIRGPLLGATFRGKVDFKAQALAMAGTYAPLSGLNSAMCALPILGLILTGPKCEGIVGFTFEIKGSLANPEVLVNPFSGLLPGIFRDILQMGPENYGISPVRTAPPPSKIPARTDGARSSSSAATAPSLESAPPVAGRPKTEILRDWSTGVQPELKK